MLEEMPDSWEEPSEMDHYLGTLERVHTKKSTDDFCGDYDPSATEMGDHTCIHCGTCGLVLHKLDA